MSNEFSFIGYETIPVGEYLPILHNIINDLNIIYDSRINRHVNMDTDILSQSIMQPQASSKFMMDSTDAISATPESDNQLCLINNGVHYPQRKRSIKSVNWDTQQNYSNVTAASEPTDAENSNVEESMATETRLRLDIHDLKEELNKAKDDNDQINEELLRSNGKIDSLKAKYKTIKDTLNDKENQIKNLNETIQNQSDELNTKEEDLRNLREEIKRIQLETSTLKRNENKKENPELQKTIEDQIRKISDLESKISKLESKQNSELAEIIKGYETKMAILETKNEEEVDQSYKVLMATLNKKRAEIREKDNKNNELENEIEEFKTKCRRLEKTNKSLSTQLENMKQEFEECEKLKDEFHEQYKACLKENKKLKKNSISEDDILKYKNELKDYKELMKKKDMEFKQNEKLVTELKIENESLSKANQNSVGKLGNMEKYKLEIDGKNKELDEKSKKIEELKAECAKKQQAMGVMRDKIRTKAEADPQETKKLNFQLKASENEVEHLHGKIDNLNTAYTEKAREHELSLKQIQNLQGEVANLKKLLNSKDRDFMATEATAVPRERSDTNEFPDWWKTHMVKK